jgi:hypothetical protein
MASLFDEPVAQRQGPCGDDLIGRQMDREDATRDAARADVFDYIKRLIQPETTRPSLSQPCQVRKSGHLSLSWSP